MDLQPSRFAPSSKSSFLITATSYSDKRISGHLYCPYLGCSAHFDNLMQLLLLMESLMDEAGCPQRGMEPRVFQGQGSRVLQTTPVEEEPSFPGLASFRIEVLFRQNASWQGSVTWSEGRRNAHFRSVLELIGLLDDALIAAQSTHKVK